MALFNHLLPYSNLHDINLDWIISIIKSIDPAVIQALQELTPDIIEQVNQKVSEAQAAAIAAKSSASEANTARENAATSAAEAAQDATETATNAAAASADAVRAENAANSVETSITPKLLSITQNTSYVSTTTVAQYQVSGKTALINIDCVLTGTKSQEYWTPIYTLGKPVSGTFFGWGYLGGTTRVKIMIQESTVYITSENITEPTGLLLFASPCFTT